MIHFKSIAYKFFFPATAFLICAVAIILYSSFIGFAAKPILPEFSQSIAMGNIDGDILDEVSGIAMSKINDGLLWIHNDSGSEPIVWGISTNGKILAKIVLADCHPRDWEDICLGTNSKGDSFILIGDIGDNNSVHSLCYIYMVKEPIVKSESTIQEFKIPKKKYTKITFKYPDGKRDAESLMFDPISKDVIIISKRESRVRAYALHYPYSANKVIKAQFIASLNLGSSKLPLKWITAADISGDGSEIIIKDYANIYYYYRNPNETLQTALLRDPESLPYTGEPQGEALCWDNNNQGYFTLSEKSGGVSPVLYYYKRK